MSVPVRLQLSRRAGFDLQRHSRDVNGLRAVNVARPSRWGNPYRIGESVDKRQVRKWGWNFKDTDFVCSDAQQAARRFSACLFLDDAIHDHVRGKLAGKNLACWCDLDAHCHADALLQLANSRAA